MVLQNPKKSRQETRSEPNGDEYETKNLDHLGLVAAQFEELGLVDLINQVMPQDREKRNVSLGHAIKAMVVNGLGFANHTLYLMPNFFEDKPVERLIGEGIEAKDLNQNLLGRCLDDIYDFDPTKLYSILSCHVVKQLNLRCVGAHIDTTSFHVDGEYNCDKEPPKEIVHITKGYSHDHRPDLNQADLQLIVENQSGIPLTMQALSGNESDKKSFNEAIKTHIKQLQTDIGIQYTVGDSALYTAENIVEMDSMLWITRVPETLSDAKWAIESIGQDLMIDLNKEAYRCIYTNYANIHQRWVVHYSPQAYLRALISVNKQCLRSSKEELNKLNKIKKQCFSCRQDAQDALEKLNKTLKSIEINDSNITKVGKFIKSGRPGKNANHDYFVWKIEGQASSVIHYREEKLKRKSCFILATNQLDEEALSEEEMIDCYKKDQQKVERGFRFLKDPLFLASTLFLKNPRRIMGLLMVMTLSLLIYATLERKMRATLEESEETVPNQLGKPIKNPTMRWIFQCFSGIHVLIVNKHKTVIMNLKPNHLKILRLMGEAFQGIYSEGRILV
jgi:transposase